MKHCSVFDSCVQIRRLLKRIRPCFIYSNFCADYIFYWNVLYLLTMPYGRTDDAPSRDCRIQCLFAILERYCLRHKFCVFPNDDQTGMTSTRYSAAVSWCHSAGRLMTILPAYCRCDNTDDYYHSTSISSKWCCTCCWRATLPWPLARHYNWTLAFLPPDADLPAAVFGLMTMRCLFNGMTFDALLFRRSWVTFPLPVLTFIACCWWRACLSR